MFHLKSEAETALLSIVYHPRRGIAEAVEVAKRGGISVASFSDYSRRMLWLIAEKSEDRKRAGYLIGLAVRNGMLEATAARAITEAWWYWIGNVADRAADLRRFILSHPDADAGAVFAQLNQLATR